MKTRLIGVAASLAVLSSLAWAAAAAGAEADMHLVSASKNVKWGPAPAILQPGAQFAVMSGDPGAKGFVSLRLKLPAGYKIAPHFHPTDEHVTVLSGTLLLGMGDKIDAKTATAVSAGGYVVAPAQMHHYAMTKTGAVLQVDLEGPFALTYVNPADDPSQKPK